MTAEPALVGVVGPTASGKTELAMALARRVPVEILVADSRQVYRGMDVGTAKPDAAARAQVPHHLVDVVDPDQPFTVAQWVDRARRLLPEIDARGTVPVLVGGTGLYVTALLDGHDYSAQPWSPERRDALSAELAERGVEPLVQRLRRLAPDVAGRIDLRNPRRVLRALERAEAGDLRLPRAMPYTGPVALVALDRPREVLHRRIDDRSRRMFTSGGLLDEVRRLRDAGYGPDMAPMTGHGYLEAMRHLAGEWSLDEAIARTVLRTRQYAKRQLTWFRRDVRIGWIAADERAGDDPKVVAAAEERIRAVLS